MIREYQLFWCKYLFLGWTSIRKYQLWCEEQECLLKGSVRASVFTHRQIKKKNTNFSPYFSIFPRRSSYFHWLWSRSTSASLVSLGARSARTVRPFSAVTVWLDLRPWIVWSRNCGSAEFMVRDKRWFYCGKTWENYEWNGLKWIEMGHQDGEIDGEISETKCLVKWDIKMVPWMSMVPLWLAELTGYTRP